MFACVYLPNPSDQLSLADFACTFSPLVEETNSSTVVLDVEGCELLFGSAYAMANEISLRATKPIAENGLANKINVSLAANPDTAIHAATNLEGIIYIAPGEELTCLGELSIEAIQYSLVGIEEKRAEELFETLRLWGIHSFRDFASLPVAGVSERLGQDGLSLQLLAAGQTERHLKLKQHPPVFSSFLQLDHSIAELEPLSFIFARLLNQLCASLHSYALATNELVVHLELDDKTAHERKLVLPYPMGDHKVFLKLLLLDTEMHPPQSAVRSVSITCEPVKPRVLQNGLFIPLAPAPDKLELTLARLKKLVGEGNVGSPELLNTHRPDAFSLKRFVLNSRSGSGRRRKAKNEPWQTWQSLGFRMYRPPIRAVVELEQDCPRQLSAWGKQRSIYGKIVCAAGPWRSTGDWWRKDRWSRDEWDVALDNNRQRVSGETSGQTFYRIYHELSSDNWFVEGSYD